MKTSKPIMIIMLSFSLFAFKCDDPICDFIELADLTIPKLVDLLDDSGQPLTNPSTGQQINASNELYYNHRTGEYFNADFPPILGLQVGDVIEIATNIFNTYSENNCKSGGNAGASQTEPTLSVNGPYFNGMVSLQGMPTPPIQKNQRAITTTAFTLATPGTYQVDFNANAQRNIEEHSYDNNYYYGNDGSYGRAKVLSFEVNDSRIFNKKSNVKDTDFTSSKAPTNIDDIKKLNIYKFLDSKLYNRWYLDKLVK